MTSITSRAKKEKDCITLAPGRMFGLLNVEELQPEHGTYQTVDFVKVLRAGDAHEIKIPGTTVCAVIEMLEKRLAHIVKTNPERAEVASQAALDLRIMRGKLIDIDL